jgi:Cu+-exporting ATPase
MALQKSSQSDESKGTAAIPTREGAVAACPPCFHCGTLCRGSVFTLEDKSFCCHGCCTVFEILSANGLTDFYNLSETAGVRITAPAKNEQFKFLDEPAVRERLVDFSDARLTRVTFHIPSIHCIACVWLLENLFQLKPGLGQTQVNFPRKQVALAFDPAQVKLSEVVTLLAALGYEPELKLSALEARPGQPVTRRLWIQLGLAGFAFGNIMLFSISSYLGLDAFAGPGFAKMVGAISLGLALPVVVYSALDYWRAAWTSLQQRLLNIDVPIAAGIAAIFAQSSYEVFTGRGEGYFDSLCGLIFFLLCGRLFQQKTYDRLAFDRDYKSFFPLSVTRKERRAPALRETDSESQRAELELRAPVETHVSLAQLVVGDQLIIRNGELIPADAKLISGPALIDYSFVTGESEPVEKKRDDYLYAGGRQMGGAIEVEMVKAVSQSYLTSLWNQDAFRKEKGELLNQITNTYSQRFTKLVIVIAVGAAAFWAFVNPALSLKSFTSVLIVACPCALALAAPFALGTAQRVLSRRNVFLKNPYVLETLAEVDAVVFDKTGTLTAAGAGNVAWLGSPPALTPALSPVEREKRSQRLGEITAGSVSKKSQVAESDQLQSPLPGGAGQGEGEPLSETEERWLFSMTRHSTHPLPVRIGEAIKRDYFPEPVRSFLETPGCGMEGSVAGHEIWLGSAAWFATRNIFAPKGNGSVVHVAIDGRYRGHFVLASAVRAETENLVAGLGRDCEVALLSGDNEKERTKFQALFGDHATLAFNQSPLDKLNFIKRRQTAGKTVMMVGDGLNDAGALRQADVGVAVVENVSAFSPASDVILAAGMVTRTAAVLRYAKQSLRVVRAAFWISAAYNVVGVAIAASGKLSPVVCAILMPVSSVTVVVFACGAAAWLGRRSFKTEAGS